LRILHVAPSFYPASYWGGPIWSTKAICDGIAALPDFDLRVLTTDAAGPNVQDRVEPVALPYPATYARRIAGHSIAPGLLARLPAAMAWADVVHLTGTYSAPTLPVLGMAKLLSKPIIWSPRGALQATQDWAGAPHHGTKHLFERAAQLLRPAHSVLHVTASAEAGQSVARLGDISTVTIPNCVDIPQLIAPRDDREGQRLLYLGRLHPKKGLLELCAAMEALPDGFTLDVYGTGDAAFVAQLQHKAVQSQGRIRLHGHVEGAAKAAAFAAADLFVLPSHSENFGIAVAEAMAHSVPVLTTTATPWQAVEQMGCGRCIDLSHDDLAQEIAAMFTQNLPEMGARARVWMRRDFSTEAMVSAFADLYRSLATLADARMPA
jgi:glycosyltransferase involved in cell wall biosynthesis